MAIALIYAPKCPQVVQEMVTESKAKTTKKKRTKYTDPNQLALNFDDAKTKKREPKPTPRQEPTKSIHDLGIRDLKKLASKAKIKRYSYYTKAELIQALDGTDWAQTPQAA